VVYTFPKQSLVYGPRQMEARIDQEPTISQQLTLWNQRGSQVIRGNLLVIPIHRSLLYIEPLYIAAETGQLPELKRVILGLGDRIVMDPTLEGAIERVFSGAQAGPPTPAIAAASAPSAGTASSTKALLDAAAAAAGRASEELQRLGAILRQLQGAGTH
jgi:uncharacterized membrane protein (UPF0182 family)